MAMKKVVYNTDEIPHLWVHRKTDEARNRQGNIYFVGDTIFSYGSHFPIARLVNRNGKDAVLFTTREYSNMTTQHKCAVRRACSHLPVFLVPKVTANSREVLAYHKAECNLLLVAARKRKTGRVMNDDLVAADRLIKSFNDYAKFFGLKTRLARPADWKSLWARSVELRSAYEEKVKEREQQRKLEQERIAEIARQKFEKILPEWEAGRFPTNQLPRVTEIYLRQRKKFIETSLGVLVPLIFARAVWELVLTARETQNAIEDVKMESLPTGGARTYPINRINTDGAVHAGCHHIKWPQIERLALKLGWLNESERSTKPVVA